MQCSLNLVQNKKPQKELDNNTVHVEYDFTLIGWFVWLVFVSFVPVSCTAGLVQNRLMNGEMNG